ncbi:Fasciclin domain-containing protein [Chaetomium strumarium]|uniref:Fasciclin domain-containing protein n=1 Tax=Chaetomium strumarium TaxID=1170767 RepID=A0AAJ0M6N2_9PEZI|nr:Fasciclin domain-containing protein [Chaetomium strumarium]
MRQAVVLFAATAAALVTPDLVSHQQISLSDKHGETATQDAVQTWWNTCPEAERLFASVEQHVTKNIERSALDSFLSVVGDDSEKDEDPRHPHHPPRPPHPPHPPRRGRGRHGHHGPHGDPEKTIYELIKDNKHTTRFAELVEEHDEIKQLLQDTEHNHTLFVPTDGAFRRIPHHRHGHTGGDDDNDDDDEKHEHKPSKEFLLALLRYHISPGLYPLGRIHNSRTLPSELHPAALEASSSSSSEDGHGQPQRIRAFTTPIVHFTRLNFHARLLGGGGDVVAKNGLIHAVDALLLPPPNTTSIIRLLPGHFSTLALALETTGLGDELEEGEGGSARRKGGGTLFAPTNAAWQRLGPRANAFLFSERGRKYLRALVEYHVVVNETLYSDAFYSGKKEKKEKHGDGDEAGEEETGYWHVDLTSLLHGKPISVDVREWKGFVSIVVNGFVRVVVRDGIANDGVIQVVDKVLIPPCKHRQGGDEETAEAEMSVEDLKRRLEPYLKADSGPEDAGDL